MAGSLRRHIRLSLAALIAVIAVIAVCLHFYTLRVREERQRQFRPVAQKAARLHYEEAVRIERIISFERYTNRELPWGLDGMKKTGHGAEARSGDEYIASLRDILPWHERWLDFQLRAKGYYTELGDGRSPGPGLAMELAQAQAALLRERKNLIAHYPNIAGLTIPNPIQMSTMSPTEPLHIQVSDPFDIQDAPDFTRPGHTFKDLDSENL